MQLLVSVRMAAEVDAALEGGADVIDAKDPRRGALGAVTAAELAAVALRAGSEVPLSAALGDVVAQREAARLVGGLAVPPRAAPTYAKLALPWPLEPTGADVLRAAVAAAARHPAHPRIVAVGYADRLTHAQLFELITVASGAGADGVLLDTADKDGRSLLASVPAECLGRWVAAAREAGLLAALAGSLGAAEIPEAVRSGADVIGVRGAACADGRNGRVSAERVRALRTAIDAATHVSASR